MTGGGGSGFGGMLQGALSGYSQFSQLGSALSGVGAFGSLGGIGPDFGLIGLGMNVLENLFGKKQRDVTNKLLKEANKKLAQIGSKIDFVAAPGYAPVSAYASGRVRSL